MRICRNSIYAEKNEVFQFNWAIESLSKPPIILRYGNTFLWKLNKLMRVILMSLDKRESVHHLQELHFWLNKRIFLEDGLSSVKWLQQMRSLI